MKKKTGPVIPETIEKVDFSEQMQKSYIDYSMSVITQRALPDVRDGLKPVQRHILFDMETLRTYYDRPHRKCARIVGDTMGKYHPHGDSSIYEALVNMAQPFKRKTPLVDGHGNFGSIEGDGAAAMRYTEARLMEYTQDVYLQDIDSTVPFIPNFDATEEEPEILPARVPLLVQGCEGIAVGMATSIPSHNLTEVLRAAKAYLKNNAISTPELLSIMPGPDFPTGGIISNQEDLLNIYETGVGKIRIRGRVEIEKGSKKTDKDRIVITEIPYTMVGNGISLFFQDLKKLVEAKQFPELVDLRNESKGEAIRIVLELKANSELDRICHMLYKKTRLEDTIGVKFLAVADKKPEVLNLREMFRHYAEFQYEINRKKYHAFLNKELEKKEIQEGLIRACDIIDLIIEIIRGSKSIKDARDCMIHGKTAQINFKTEESEREAAGLHFTEKQATAILEMRLSKLIGLEILALKKENEKTVSLIAKYREILENSKVMTKTVIDDLTALEKKYPQERRTKIEAIPDVVFEEKVVEQDLFLLVDRFGYVKTIDTSTYERNKDTVDQENPFVVLSKNTDKLYFFTDTGNQYAVKNSDIPFGKLRDKSIPLANLSGYDPAGENLLLVIAQAELEKSQLVFLTKNSMIKRVDGVSLVSRKRTMTSIKFKTEEDKLLKIQVIGDGEDNLSCTNAVLYTKNGYFNRFLTESIPKQKKNAVGAEGMKLKAGDELAGGIFFSDEEDPVVELGNKEVRLKRLKVGSRGSGGIKNRG